MYKNRILKLVSVLLAALILIVPVCVAAATTSTYEPESFKSVILKGSSAVGRYRFNYTGNTNYYQYWMANDKNEYVVKTYDSPTTNNVSKVRKTAAAGKLGLKKDGKGDPDKITNSSSAKLSASRGATGIYKAYLVWQTRSANGESSPIALVMPDNSARAITAQAAYRDRRQCITGAKWDYHSMYCMYADVTEYVKSYGTYSVCNIPIWSATGTEGGESIASWELIVIEEGENFPIRATKLQMTSTFDRNKKTLDAESLTMELEFPEGVKTPVKEKDSEGNAINAISGQVFFGGSCSGDGKLTESIKFFNGTSGKGSKNIDKSTAGGLSGSSGTPELDKASCIRMDLSDFSEKNFYDATKAELTIKSEKWTSFFLFGLAVDVAQPEVTSSQQTTVNSSTSVTVIGRVDNNSTQAKTGYYDGTLTVTLDSALTATNATMTVYNKYKPEETTVINGVSSGNIVIFNGESVRGKAKGSYLIYSIDCSVDTVQGKTEFNNSHELTGTLFSRDYETGVNVFLTSALSKGTPMYSVTLVPADHIDTVSATDLSASKASVTKDYTYGTPVSITATPKTGCEFTKWVDDGGTEITSNPYSFSIPNRNTTFTAYGKLVYYSVTLHAGTGIESVDGAGLYKAGDMVNIGAALKEGYHWLNWTGTYNTDSMNYGFTMPAQNVDMTANGEANSYTIHFDPNGGIGHIDDIQTTYDTDVALPDATDVYKKYTLDGVNITDDVVSGAISEDVILMSESTEETEEDDAEEITAEISELSENGDEEVSEEEGTGRDGKTVNEDDRGVMDDGTDTEQETEETEQVEDSDEENGELETEEDMKVEHSLREAYPSVFLGWALYDDKDRLTPTWKAGDVVKNLTAENGGEITLYAVWDDCPWITATDLYYTLEQAQSGFITEEEILSHASAVDREDGSPILPGINPAINNPVVNTSFTIPDYQESEFTSLTHDAAISENLTVVDSVGSTYQKQIMVYIVDTTPVAVKPKGTTRFISKKYFNADYNHGGLEDNSIWKTNPEYQAVLQEALDNLENDTSEMSFSFTQEQIEEMKEYVKQHGIGNSKEPDALQKFWEKFMEPNRIR